MSAPVLDASLIAAAGMDAGNQSARKAGRAVWNEDDRNRAGEVIAYLSVVAGRIEPEDYAACGWGEFKRRRKV